MSDEKSNTNEIINKVKDVATKEVFNIGTFGVKIWHIVAVAGVGIGAIIVTRLLLK